MFEDRKGQGATEYLLILAAVLVIAASAVYFVTQTGGYPAVGAVAVGEGDEVRINVNTGSIPAGEWEVQVSDEPNVDGYTGDLENEEDVTSTNTNWYEGDTELAAPYVLLGKGDGTFYVTLRHKPTGHVYFSDQSVTVNQ